jgi:hypothetical protein
MKYSLHLSIRLAVVFYVCAGLASNLWSATAPRSSAFEERGVQSHETVTVIIPGPLRSFLRMAGISQKISPEEVMPLLARNIFMTGYSKAQPTEFLILLRRYVHQARELAALAGPDGLVRVSSCDDAKQLLDILGYRMPPDCGKDNAFLQAADPRRAFLTIDSGFPLVELERTLQGGKPFVYSFPNSQVPIILTERDWTAVGNDDGSRGLLDALLRDPALARLYYAWAHMDPETQAALHQSPGLKKLVPVADALDFYGSYIRIRSGNVMVPGGPGAEARWKDLVGASPQSYGEFVFRLLTKDNGWLAAYFDSLARVPLEQQAHFLEASRLQRCYEALRGKNASPSATASVFRPDANLLLLMTRLQWEPNGDPHVPGSLRAWKNILGSKTNSDLARRWKVGIRSWNNSEGLLEAMFAFSRVQVAGGPTEAFLVLSEIDGKRPVGHRLSSETVELLGSKFSEFRNQYLIFSEFSQLSDVSITNFLTTATALGKISDHTLRGNAMGIFEANVGLWQILARQDEIDGGTQDNSWQEMIRPFAHISSSAQLFDAGRNSLGKILRAAGGGSTDSQDEIVDLIAGPRQTNPESQRIRGELANRIRATLDDQRLVSLDTLLALGEGLGAMAQGTPLDDKLIPLAKQLTEFQMPRPIFTNSERIRFTAGSYDDRHTELEMRTDLVKILKTRATSAQFDQARGLLVPFLRDTLVGFSYAYYEPPGAQALHNNPLLIRSHDFSAETIIGMEESVWRTPLVFGAGSPAGGGAHLVGSLADLPYVLAQLEQDFISPENVQALIWSDLVPTVLTAAILPRWWAVSRKELHAIALYQRSGDELLAASVKNEELRLKVTNILSSRLTPHRSAQLEGDLQKGLLNEVSITPADSFYLAAEFRRRFPGEINSCGIAGRELEDLSHQDPVELSWQRLSQDFGVPHPTLAHSYARELLNLSPFPMFEGYSSRLLAETWDSTNLYWARLADEMGYAPVMLNHLAPELTARMVAKIFATDLDDWPAILRAIRETGEEFRQGKVASLSSNGDAAQR